MYTNNTAKNSKIGAVLRRILPGSKIKSVLVILILICPILIYLSFLPMVNLYINSKNWFAEDTSFHVNGTIYFHNLHNLDRKINLDTVVVTPIDRTIMINGGSISINLNNKKVNESGIGKWKISANNLNIIIIKDKIKAELSNGRYEDGKVSFSDGVVTGLPVDPVIMTNGSVENKIIKIKNIYFNIKLPINIPNLTREQNIRLENSIINYESKLVDVEKVLVENDIGETHSYITNMSVNYSDIVTILMDSFSTRYKWLSRNDDFKDFNKVGLFWLRGDRDKLKYFYSVKVGSVYIIGNKSEIISKDNSCVDWLTAMPTQEKMPFDDFELISGKFNFELNIDKPSLKMMTDCSIVCNNDMFNSLRKKFFYSIIEKDGEEYRRESGPKSENWIPLKDMSPEAHKAVIMLEDPGFEYHKGYHRMALLNSLKINLKNKRFVRGGSTITMQLVRNLWLGRDKTLDRKLVEIIWSEMLERCFSKYEILELYMNVVEFGPGMYGIANASKYYFDKHPRDLMPDEALFLARALPNPSRMVKPEFGGMKSVHSFMRKWDEINKLPEDFDMPEVLGEN